jgi:hypothetical protein
MNRDSGEPSGDTVGIAAFLPILHSRRTSKFHLLCLIYHRFLTKPVAYYLRSCDVSRFIFAFGQILLRRPGRSFVVEVGNDTHRFKRSDN